MAKEDIDFIYTLQAQVNATASKRVDYLFFAIIGFFVVAILWASLSNIDELARGEGKVIPSEKIQTIQNLDGGIVSEILVKEGEFVKVGEALMKIDTTRFQATLDEDEEAYFSLLAKKARLEAEYEFDVKKPNIKLIFNKSIKRKGSSFVKNETNLFNTRIDEFVSSLNILETQLAQKVQELVGLKSKKRQLNETVALVKEENSVIIKMVKSGSKSKFDLISSKKELSNILGEQESIANDIPKAEYAVDEVKNRLVERLKNFKSEALQELVKLNNELKRYESKVIIEKDKLDNSIVKSTVNGFIKVININTIGGVVKSGQDLIEIVPQSDILIVEAKIDPKDIAFISPELKAIVKITAYDFSIYGGLDGEIIEISADSIIDKESKDNKPYYRVLVKTNKNYLEKNGKQLPIIPGMIASIDIVTGQKSILDFLLKPILKTKQDALHER